MGNVSKLGTMFAAFLAAVAYLGGLGWVTTSAFGLDITGKSGFGWAILVGLVYTLALVAVAAAARSVVDGFRSTPHGR